MARSKLEGLTDEILREVKPSNAEIKALSASVNSITTRLKALVPKNVEILVAGSTARGTQVRGNSDIDIFLLFPRSEPAERIEKKGLEIAKRLVNKRQNESYLIKYAEHPYTRLTFGNLGLDVEIVPAYKIETSKERGTAVDRTQLHNKFINSKLTDRQRDDVRVLKTFLHSHNIYGAEARIEGFSGYLCEILIYHYGSFLNLLNAVSRVRLPIALDVLNRREYKGHAPELRELMKMFNKDFIVIDPTDSNRNVAASVSHESLARFALISRGLVETPDRKHFFKRGFSDLQSRGEIAKLRKELNLDIYLISFKVPEIAEEIVWQQLKRLGSRLGMSLKDSGFESLLTLQNIDGKKAIIAFLVRRGEATSSVVRGPSIFIEHAYEEFVKAHRGSGLFAFDGDRILSIEGPKYRTPMELLKKELSDTKTALPSYLDRKGIRILINRMPEQYARMLYMAYEEKRL